MEKNKAFLKRSKLIEKISIFVDLLFAVAYISIFLRFFSFIVVGKDAPVKPDLKTIAHGWLKNYNTGEVNLWLCILTLFILVAIPLIFVNVKKIRTLDDYSYNKWSCANMFSNGIINLVSLNPISAGLRFYNTFVLMKYVEGYGFVGFFKVLGKFIKEIPERSKTRKEKKGFEKNNLTDEGLSIEKKIRRQNISRVFGITGIYLFLTFLGLFIVLPFYWMVITSLKTYDQTVAIIPEFFISPRGAQWINIKYVINTLQFGKYIKNTVFVAILSTLGTVVTTVLASFAFARLEFKGKGLFFSLLLMTMMIPGELYIITNYLTISRTGFGWVGGTMDGFFIAMIVPFMTSVSYIFFLRQAFRSVPDALYKAAKVDGCSDIKFLFRILFPIAGPTVFTISILSIFGSWNAYIWPNLIASAAHPVNAVGKDYKDFWLVSVALRNESFNLPTGVGGADARPMANLQIAASMIVTVPLLVVFLMFKKRVMSGVGRSGTKG